MDTFRKNYTQLSEQQKAEMQAIKEKAEELEQLLSQSIQREPRLMALAKTHLENAVLWAVKAVTTEEKGGANPAQTSEPTAPVEPEQPTQPEQPAATPAGQATVEPTA